MRTRQRVGLLDLTRSFGQISPMLDLEPRSTILDTLGRIARLDESLLSTMAMRRNESEKTSAAEDDRERGADGKDQCPPNQELRRAVRYLMTA